MTISATREQVLAYRVRTQQLDRADGALGDTAVLRLGVQDTGVHAASWALANRGLDVGALGAEDLAMAWTLRGAPHVYRREDLPSVAAAVQPFSDADAGKRVFDAAAPLHAAGIPVLAALDHLAEVIRDVVVEPMAKGEVSRRVTGLLEEPYLRHCRPCRATHPYENAFRLSALRGGLELQAGTSPPVLQRIPGLRRPVGGRTRHDVVRAVLHLLGPVTPRHVAAFLDAALPDVRDRWPDDVEEVAVAGERRWLLGDDVPALGAGGPTLPVRLLGPYDLFLQARDRALLVPDAGRRKELWPVLGRPGAVLVEDEVAGACRARKAGATLTVRADLWTPVPAPVHEAVAAQAERLAAHRGLRLAALEVAAA